MRSTRTRVTRGGGTGARPTRAGGRATRAARGVGTGWNSARMGGLYRGAFRGLNGAGQETAGAYSGVTVTEPFVASSDSPRMRFPDPSSLS